QDNLLAGALSMNPLMIEVLLAAIGAMGASLIPLFRKLSDGIRQIDSDQKRQITLEVGGNAVTVELDPSTIATVEKMLTAMVPPGETTDGHAKAGSAPAEKE